jgi:hypothetical protein
MNHKREEILAIVADLVPEAEVKTIMQALDG